MGFDLGPVVQALSFDSISVVRTTETITTGGLVSKSTAALGTFTTSVQPIQGKNAVAQLELIRADAGVSLWSTEDFIIPGPGVAGSDKFVWNSDTYEIRAKSNWTNCGNYQQYLAGKL